MRPRQVAEQGGAVPEYLAVFASQSGHSFDRFASTPALIADFEGTRGLQSLVETIAGVFKDSPGCFISIFLISIKQSLLK